MYDNITDLNLMSFCSAAWNSVLGLELQLAGQPPSAGYSVGQTRYGQAPSFWQISRQYEATRSERAGTCESSA